VKYQRRNQSFGYQNQKVQTEEENVKLRYKQAIGGLLRLLLVIRDATVWAHVLQPIRFGIVLEGAEAGPSVASEMSPLSARSTVHPVTRRATATN
jgi:hypothetical protein